MIRKCTEADFLAIYNIINSAAQAYKGIIPEDRWHEPYMSREELAHEIADGVLFWGLEREQRLMGVMGMQYKGEVDLIRHAYVRPENQKQGVGTELLRFLESKTERPILIGTWAAATWAITFYQRNGYRLIPEAEKNRLLRRYWTVPERQMESSVVLVNRGANLKL